MKQSDLPPVIIHDGAQTLYYSAVDARHRPTQNCKHRVNGEVLGSATILIIYQVGLGSERSYCLLGYNSAWSSLDWTLTRHKSLEEAKGQAEFEYEGISRTWETFDAADIAALNTLYTPPEG